MTRNWKSPRMKNVVFSRSPAATSTFQYPDARSSVLNHWAPASASKVSSMREIGCASIRVTAFSL
ncbi:hypothetical protein T11_6541 [Trichinella zimbabwensis]|uniref:Uncharacterized protein n=1 Tax=Trichinella zimbabwensis TaxID=268475 RepID=A0A0V1GXB9_9BILA|nr:hypothetical protein T11_6541 [Trichinella zimbabwensis]